MFNQDSIYPIGWRDSTLIEWNEIVDREDGMILFYDFIGLFLQF